MQLQMKQIGEEQIKISEEDDSSDTHEVPVSNILSSSSSNKYKINNLDNKEDQEEKICQRMFQLKDEWKDQ